MHSLSATYDDAVGKFAWYTFDGPRGREVTQRSHKRMIKKGDVYGLLATRGGARYTLIFPDMPHVEFPADRNTADFLMDRSKKMRKPPEIAQRQGRAKAAGVTTIERQLARKSFDNPRFAPRRVPVESVNGINFENYQWRIVPDANYKLRHSKGLQTFSRNELIGLRFLRDSKGGIVINPEGLYLKVPTEDYDMLVANSNVLPYPDWPQGHLSEEDVMEYRRASKIAHRRTAAEEAESRRLAARAERIAVKTEAKLLRNKEREASRAEEQRLAEMRAKVRSGEMEAPRAKVLNEDDLLPKPVKLRSRVRRILQEEILDDEDLEFDEALVEHETEEDEQLANLFGSSPFVADVLNIENSVAKMFGKDDDDELPEDDDGAFDMSDIDEPEDDEEPPARSKVRKKQKGTAPVAASPEATEDDSDDPDESSDDEEDVDLDDVEEEDDEDVESDESEEDTDEESDDETEDDEDAEDEEDPDAETDDDSDVEDSDADEEEDEEAADGDGDDDADTSDAVEETDEDDAEDDDVAAAEDEAAKTAREVAAANASPAGSAASEAEEGDVVRFKADAKLRRDWVVLKISTHNASDNIVVYTVYDITNSPDEVRQVRVNRARKQNLFDYCEHIKDMTPKLFNRVLDMAEDYPVNREPIAS